MLAVGADDRVPVAAGADDRPDGRRSRARSRGRAGRGRPATAGPGSCSSSRGSRGARTRPAGSTAVARAAQQVGLEGIALMDHLIQIPQVGREWEDLPEPFVTLGLLAGAAPGLRLGTLVSPVSLRTAGLLAKTVATLDVLTGGRAFCGIGAGWWGREHAAYGLPFPPARRAAGPARGQHRGDAGAVATGHGGVLRASGSSCPRPPATRGRSGRCRSSSAAAGRGCWASPARLGDACNLPSDPAVLEPGIALVRAACEEAGRDPAEVAVTVLDVPVVGRDREHAAQLVERLRGRTAAAAYARAHHAGMAADHAERYRELAELGVSTVFVALPGPGRRRTTSSGSPRSWRRCG